MQHQAYNNQSTEEKEAFTYLGGKGLWQNWKNNVTGEHSLHTHTLKVVRKFCKEDDHYWEIVKNGTAKCKHCNMERNFVLGLHKIKDGKFVSVK